MMNELNLKQKNFELQQKQKMMMGTFVEQKIKLSYQEIQNLKKYYVGMYYALASINWGQGMTLGMAWQKALEQMNAFVTSKTKVLNNPVNEQLIKIHSDFRRDMSKSIMTSKYAEEKLNPEYTQSFINYGTKRVNETKKSLNDIFAKYMPKQDMKKTKTKTFDIAKQRAQQLMRQILLQQMKNNQRAV